MIAASLGHGGREIPKRGTGLNVGYEYGFSWVFTCAPAVPIHLVQRPVVGTEYSEYTRGNTIDVLATLRILSD